jgi:hypothetical protein
VRTPGRGAVASQRPVTASRSRIEQRPAWQSQPMSDDVTLEACLEREAVFIDPAMAATRSAFEDFLAPDFMEAGASGRVYSREEALGAAAASSVLDGPSQDGWSTRDELLRQLGRDAYVLTYTLEQRDRITRRATIWERVDGRWRVVHHQGTLVPDMVADDEAADD